MRKFRKGREADNGYWFPDSASIYLSPAGTGGRYDYPDIKSMRRAGWVDLVAA